MYQARQIIEYIRTMHDRATSQVRNLTNSDLELAVAGVPNDFLSSKTTTDYGNVTVPQNKYSYGIRDISTDGKNVTIIRSDGKTIALHPESVKHEVAGYVSAVLGNNGLHPKTSTFKKITAMVENIRKKRKSPNS